MTVAKNKYKLGLLLSYDLSGFSVKQGSSIIVGRDLIMCVWCCEHVCVTLRECACGVVSVCVLRFVE
eukprot:m.77116 g.77116  ORF g.77116 m.77116 type:complete len:67 (+) comp24979_c0_seq1:38-238(+)